LSQEYTRSRNHKTREVGDILSYHFELNEIAEILRGRHDLPRDLRLVLVQGFEIMSDMAHDLAKLMEGKDG
jgi:hypothetical protein